MRFEGHLKSWDDDRGFGFIETQQGGKDVFVHISAFPPGRGRPVVEQRLSFELSLENDGRLRATEVELVGKKLVGSAPSPPLPKKGSLLFLPAFLLLYLGVDANWGVPSSLLLLYAAASLITFGTYAIDKWSAQRGGQRVAEKTLHGMALLGGWPGAILGQVLLRHKSSKPSFRVVFWVTVALNAAAFVILCSPYAPPAIRAFLQSISPAFRFSS